MNKFTPGPWRYRAPDRDTMQRHKVFGPPHPVDGGDYAPLAEFSNGDDAILTASAPDMAEALEAAKVALLATIPLLIKLGDYIANADQRCETILQVREAIDEAAAVLAKTEPTEPTT